MSETLSVQTQTLYAELLERLLAEEARRSVGKAAGTFVKKAISGETYVYFQYSEPGGRYRQLYLGKDSEQVQRLIRRFRDELPDAERSKEDRERLCAQLRIGGVWSMGSGPARVLRAFAEAGLFESGAVVVGTHAFGTLGNLLGARWRGANLRTEDLDLAAISVAAVSKSEPSDATKALDRLAMGFLPVPRLDPRHPSTSFKVRGGSLRVDFLTPGSGQNPLPLSKLGTWAQPLPFLDYLIEAPERAAVAEGAGFLVLVPSPARFALHKLIVAGERPAMEQTKIDKDFAQAAQLIAFLAEARPGDLRLAAEALRKRRGGSRLTKGWRALSLKHPELASTGKALGLAA